MNIRNKNAFFAVGGVIIIILGYYLYNYFYPAVSTENEKTSDTIFNEEQPLVLEQGGTRIASKEQSLVKLQELSGYKNLSDFKGKEIYDLIQILEKLRLDMDFFNSVLFKSLIDYTYEVSVTDEEKGNVNPFTPVKGAFISKSVSTTTTAE